MRLLLTVLVMVSVIIMFSTVEYSYATTNNEGTFDGSTHFVNAKNPGIEMKFCKNTPWSTYGWDDPSYATMDQQKLKQLVYEKCIDAEPNFEFWPTGSVKILISAPAWNTNENQVDVIGKQLGSDNITCSSSDAGFYDTASSNGLGMVEIGTDTGLFGGALSLSGPSYKRLISESGTYQYGSSDAGDGTASYGSVKTCKLKTSNSGSFTVNWEFSEDQHIIKSGQYSYREADVAFGKDVYGIDDEIKIKVNDRDMLRWSYDSKSTPIKVWSDSDLAGIEVMVKYKRQFWIPDAEDGNHEATITLTTTDDSLSGGDTTNGRLHVSPGDHIYAQYLDYTLPPPSGEDGCKIGFGPSALSAALSSCENKIITNFALVSDYQPKFPITLTTTSDDDLPTFALGDVSVITPTDYAFTKYTSDGLYKVVLWANSNNELEKNADNRIKMIFYDGFTEKQLTNVKYDFKFVNADKTTKTNINTLDGYSTQVVNPIESNPSKLIISNINGSESNEIQFMIPVVDEINDMVYVKSDARALDQITSETFVDYLETLDMVPNWILTTVSYWDSGSISDVEFVNQMKFLVQNNYI